MTRLTSIALITTGLLAAANLTSLALANEAPWYEVEVFVFEHPSADTEKWSEEVKLAKTQDAVDFITPTITTDISSINLGISTADNPPIDCNAPNWSVPNTDSYDNSAGYTNHGYDSGSQAEGSRAYITDEYGQLIEMDSSNIAATNTDSSALNSPEIETAPAPQQIDEQMTDPNSECEKQFAQSEQTRLSEVPVSIAAHVEKQAIWGTQNQLLAQSQSQFGDMIAKISREPGAKPLLHMTWQQVMLPRHRAKPVRLFAGQDLSAQFNLDGTKVDTSQIDVLSQFGFLQDYFAAKEDMPVWQLDGLFNIYLNHYLYVETQLNYREAGIKTAAIENAQQETADTEISLIEDDTAYLESESSTPFLYAIPMTQNRRVRSSEIHYLDHPKLGIVFQIRKMPQPEKLEPIELNPQPTGEESQTFGQNSLSN